MRKYLKLISMCLVLVSLTTVLSSCGKDGIFGKLFGGNDDIPTIVWYMRSPVADMSQEEKVEAAANKIIEPKIGAKLDFKFIEAAAWEDKKNMLVSTGGDFDIIFEAGDTFVNNAQRGAYLDLRPYMNDKVMPEILKRNDQFVWDAVTFPDGGVYAVPAETFYVPYTSFAFKADIVDKYNFDYMSVDSYDDLIPLFESVKKNEKGMYGAVDLPMLQSTKYIPTTDKNVVFDIENDKFIPIIESPDQIAYWKTVKSFVDKGYMPKDAGTKEVASEIKAKILEAFYNRAN